MRSSRIHASSVGSTSADRTPVSSQQVQQPGDLLLRRQAEVQVPAGVLHQLPDLGAAVLHMARVRARLAPGQVAREGVCGLHADDARAQEGEVMDAELSGRSDDASECAAWPSGRPTGYFARGNGRVTALHQVTDRPISVSSAFAVFLLRGDYKDNHDGHLRGFYAPGALRGRAASGAGPCPALFTWVAITEPRGGRATTAKRGSNPVAWRDQSGTPVRRKRPKRYSQPSSVFTLELASSNRRVFRPRASRPGLFFGALPRQSQSNSSQGGGDQAAES